MIHSPTSTRRLILRRGVIFREGEIAFVVVKPENLRSLDDITLSYVYAVHE